MTNKTISLIKSIVALVVSISWVLAPCSVNAEGTKPLSHIYTDCLFTYYYSYVEDTQKNYHKTFCFESRSIEDREYMAMIECDEYGDYDSGNEHCIYAYLREEDNKVYMLLGSTFIPYWSGCVYGMTDKETMIYDYSLEPGESYRIGELSDYFILPENPAFEEVGHWIMDNYFQCPYTYLALWDYGTLTLKEKRIDENSGREILVYSQKFLVPDDHYYYPEKNRTFEVIDGFGCMQSLVAFPGLFPPAPNILARDVTPQNPILCKVQKLDTKEILFERTDLPHQPLVEELDADGNAEPEYYNLQGQRVAAPEVGSIYIVKRGAKANKEVYRQ